MRGYLNLDKDEQIIKELVDEGKIDKKKLVPIFKIHKTNKEPLEKLIISFKLAEKQDVLKVKARVYQGEPIMLDVNNIDREVAKVIPQAMAKKYNLICPRKTDDGKMVIAMHDPSDTFALEYVQMRTGIDVKPYLALLVDIEGAWGEVYSEEKKKRHPFFKDRPQTARTIKKIPKILTLPGYTKTTFEEETEGEKKTRRVLKEATALISKKTGEEEHWNKVADSIQNELKAYSILSRSGTILNSMLNEEVVIHKILETAAQITNAQGASILITEEQTLYFKEVVGPKSQELKQVRIPLNESSIAGWVAIHKTPVAVDNVTRDPRHYKGIDKMLDMETNSVACVPLLWGDEALGVMEAVNKNSGVFGDKDLDYLKILASQASVALHNAILVDQFQNFYMEVVEILIECLEAMDPLGRDHALQVARLTAALARELNVDDDEFESLCYAAFLHDIGKIKCPDDDDKSCHSLKGAQMLAHIDFFKSFVPYVKYHHERFDGSGVPEGLSGEDIPLGARILAIADGFSMGRMKRPDIPEDIFIEQFSEFFGQAYDPELKDVFLKAVKQI